jgi:hypothetical protein
MGREVRYVPPDWQHPIKEGRYKPLRQLDMPHWKNGEATHIQMYETTSEGTPISPVMDTPEHLARWLVDNEISAYAGQTASYEAWLVVAQGRTIISGVVTSKGVISGAEAAHQSMQSEQTKQDAFSKIDEKLKLAPSRGLERE